MTKTRAIQHVYHLADERNWQSIQTDGLMSATALLEKNKLDSWIFCHRPDAIELNNGSIIRDQRPMPPSALQRCLTPNLTPADWYSLLNQRIFFWIDLERLHRQRLACASPQYILTIDAPRLLEKYAAHTTVTAFNTGNARRAAV